MFTRRNLLKQTALLGAFHTIPLKELLAYNEKKKFSIGACDWSLGKDSSIEAFDIARQIGLDGIMVNMGSVANNLHLREKAIQQAYVTASDQTGIKISSIAIGELNNVSYKSDPRTEKWVWDSIDVAKNLEAPVVLLAFFNKNDLRNDSAGQTEVIRRLKQVAPEAEKKGVILGIESYLDAAGHLNIIEKVGSKNVKAYVDFRNTADAGYDVIKEVKLLGKNNICELHIKENGFLLGNGTMNWQRIGKLLYEMDYFGDGWMQIEWAIPANANIITGYQHNLKFLHQLFNKEV